MVISPFKNVHLKYRLIHNSSKQLHDNFHPQSSGSTINMLSLHANEKTDTIYSWISGVRDPQIYFQGHTRISATVTMAVQTYAHSTGPSVIMGYT